LDWPGAADAASREIAAMSMAEVDPVLLQQLPHALDVGGIGASEAVPHPQNLARDYFHDAVQRDDRKFISQGGDHIQFS
jgi:hypothetical protein